jgi:hypothetical protein
LVGLLYGFFIAIICGQRITERHYHVLAKQELTKVGERKKTEILSLLIDFSFQEVHFMIDKVFFN